MSFPNPRPSDALTCEVCTQVRAGRLTACIIHDGEEGECTDDHDATGEPCPKRQRMNEAPKPCRAPECRITEKSPHLSNTVALRTVRCLVKGTHDRHNDGLGHYWNDDGYEDFDPPELRPKEAPRTTEAPPSHGHETYPGHETAKAGGGYYTTVPCTPRCTLHCPEHRPCGEGKGGT